MSTEFTSTESSSRSRMGWILRPYVARLAAAVVLLIGLTGVNIAVPQLIGRVFQELMDPSGGLVVGLILGGLLLLFMVRNLLYFYSKYSAVRVGEDVAFELRNRLFERLQQMNLQYYRTNKPGNLSSRVMNDSFAIQTFIQDELPSLCQAALLFVGIIAAMYATNWQLALATTIVLPLHLVVFHYFKGPIKSASRSAQQHMADATGNLIEKFLGMEVVKGFTAEHRESQAFESAIDASRQSQLRSKKYHVGQKVAADLLIGMGMIGLIGFGAYQVMSGRMEAGYLITFFLYVKEVNPTVIEMMGGFAKLTKTSASVDRINDVLQTRGAETAGGGKKPEIHGRLVFDRVSFSYPDSPPVLRQISFEVEPGEVCAILGHSGAGKSTLVNLVPRFHDPDNGSIFIDDIEAREIDRQHLRQAVGIAFQECFLFNSTILENLRYARPRATREEIVKVAQRVGADEFIVRLPQGYDTMVGENGVTLSRGQKQLINLARAMLKNPMVLILDEATASIDDARERQTMQAILEFMKGKTTLMITHRADMLQHAHKVLQLVEGEVAYFGPPPETPAMLASTTNDPISPFAPGHVYRPDRPDEPIQGDDRPDARPSGSGIWRGIKILVLTAMIGIGTVANTVTPALADNDEPAADIEAVADQVPEIEDVPVVPPDAQDETEAMDILETLEESELTGRGQGMFKAMPGINETEVRELLDVVISRIGAELGYGAVSEDLDSYLPDAPAELRRVTELSRSVDDEHHLLQIGYKDFLTQPTHLWLYGQTVSEQEVTPNEDLEQLEALIGEVRAARDRRAEEMTVADLGSRIISLSYAEPDRALGVLKSFGYETIEYTSGNQGPGGYRAIQPSQTVNPQNLPIVVALPASDAADAVRAGSDRDGNPPNLPHTSANPMMELLVLYDPARPEQLADVKRRIKETVDKPARQVLVEAMVLEVSERGIESLGVEWELDTPFSSSPWSNIESITAGRRALIEGRETTSLDVRFGRVFGHFDVRLEALIRSGEAEILSRPSVLTLDNRQASINVGERIPIARSISHATADRLEFNFEYIDVGIFLNLRPRVTAEGNEVSMQISGEVSAEVPGQGLEIRDREGLLVGSAPRISERRVLTYSRITDNTPFIIGGLISKNVQQDIVKVPLLGDIPIIKHMFRSTRFDELTREVIIVITPYVLPENQIVGRHIPKDEDAFDSFGNKLFRDAYRIRDEDVFDLSFLIDNPQLRRMQRLADYAVSRNSDLEDRYPFNRFVRGRIPGEEALVFRQMYELIQRLNLEERVDINRIIYFEPQPDLEQGFSVAFLGQTIDELAREAWFEQYPDRATHLIPDDPLNALQEAGKAVAMTYTLREQADEILDQPVVDLRLIDAPTRSVWSQKLWELNQPDEEGRQRYTVIIQSRRDMERLQTAHVLEKVVELNATEEDLTLQKFTIGRQLLMPALQPDQMYVLDSDVAKYFFMTEQYYPALQQQLLRHGQELQNYLRGRGMIDGPGARRGRGRTGPSEQ